VLVLKGFFYSIRGKLLLAGVLMQVCLLGLYFFLTSSVLSETLLRNVVASAETNAEILHMGVAPYVYEKRYDVLQDFFTELILHSKDGLTYVVVQDEQGQKLVAAGSYEMRLNSPSKNAKEALSGGVYHMRKPILLSGNTIGFMQFGLSTVGVADLLQNMIRLAFWVSLFGMCCSLLLLLFFGQRVNRRFSLLIQATQEILAGNFLKKVPDQGHDELAKLAKSFNAMSVGLELRERKFIEVFNTAPIPMLLFSYDDVLKCYRHLDSNVAAMTSLDFSAQNEREILPISSVNHADSLRVFTLLQENQDIPTIELELLNKQGGTQPFLVSGQHFKIEDQTFLIVTALSIFELRESQTQLLKLNAELESRVASRTEELERKNFALDSALHKVTVAQEQLIQSEKLSSLGIMVAGVAHELNTPIGNALLVASVLKEDHAHLLKSMEVGMRKSNLESFLEKLQLAMHLLLSNLQRSADLISSFKSVAVDRTTSQRRKFELSTLIDEIILSMQPSLNQSSIKIFTNFDSRIELDSYPGPLGQVLSNLIDNSILHGFSANVNGEINIATSFNGQDHAVLSVRDNGSGIAPENLSKIFDPFFTTKLGKGGSGLGLNIVYTIVTGLLGGQVQVNNIVQGGCEFTILLPINAPLGKTVDEADSAS
jgi:signal transduction histidine kinase/HAMP domain-containing protein